MPDSDTSTEFIFGPLSTEAGRVQRARTLRVGLQHDAVLSSIDPQPDEPIEITVRAGVGAALKTATLCYTIDGTRPDLQLSSTNFIPMERTAVEWDTLVWVHVETWNATIPPQPAGTCVRYLIHATTLDDRVISCPWIEPAASPEDYDQHYLARLQRYGSPRIFEFTIDTTTAPDWLRHVVIYQIFVDRFAPNPDRSFSDETDLSGFYGGTLRGITNRLAYLRDLGVTCLWLTPIFSSPSHHGYDITDYYSIEARLGNEADLRDLIAAAHQNGIRVILDFVANHISKDHPAFRSAEHDPASSYRDWFFFHDDTYTCFYDLPDLPIVNTDKSAVREYLIGAAQRWLSLGCDGFRLDHAHGATHAFWSAFRAATRAVKADAAIFGEITDTPELMRSFAGRMDGALDFYLLELLRGFFAFQSITASQFDRALRQHYSYFGDALVLPSFLDNHDMNRFLWSVGGDTRCLKLAALCQFTLPQPPIVYYGTEVGLSQRQAVGRLEEARLPMLWGDQQDQDLLKFYRKLIALRRQTVEVWSLPRETVLIDDERGLYTYRCGAYTVYLNNSAAAATIACQSTKLVLTTDAAATLISSELHLPPCGGAVVRSD
jgi:cyclomaltodextrinase / maltogenic alpha-amylase / neopullulanase